MWERRRIRRWTVPEMVVQRAKESTGQGHQMNRQEDDLVFAEEKDKDMEVEAEREQVGGGKRGNR